MFRVTIPEGTLEWEDGRWAGDLALIERAEALVEAGEFVYGTHLGPQVKAGRRTVEAAFCTALRVVQDEATARGGARRPPVWEGDLPSFDVPDGAVS